MAQKLYPKENVTDDDVSVVHAEPIKNKIGLVWVWGWVWMQRWGWGWVILLIFYVSAWSSLAASLSSVIVISFYIPFAGMVFLFFLYFKLRNRAIRKGSYSKTWIASLLAGIAVWLLTWLLIFFSGLLYFAL